MLELIFQGFIEWIYSLVLEGWEYFSTALLDIMSMDLAYIKSHVPVITDIMQVLLAVGWALLLGNLVFQAMKGMASGLGFEAEDPKMLFGRTFVFAFLLVGSPQICEIGLNLTSRIITLLKLPDAIDVHLVDASIFGNLLAAWLIVIIFDLIIMFKVLKLLLKIAEQYVVLSTLTITAPLAFAMGGSRNTAAIFSGWCRMYGSMCPLMVTNVMFFKMLLSAMATIPSGLDVIPWMVLISAIVKVARKADDIITRIGLNPAMTGNDRGRNLPGMLAHMVLHNTASQVVKALGTAVSGGAGAAGTAAAGGAAAAGTAATGGIGAAAAALGSVFSGRGGRSGRGGSSGAGNGNSGAGRPAGSHAGTGRTGGTNRGGFAGRNGAGYGNPGAGGAAGQAGTAGAAGVPGAAGTSAPGSRPNGGQSAASSHSTSATQQERSQQNSTAHNGGTSSTSSVASSRTYQGGGTRGSRKSSVPSGTWRAPSYVPAQARGSGTNQSSNVSGSSNTSNSNTSTSTIQRSGSFGGGSRGASGASGTSAASSRITTTDTVRSGSFGGGRRDTSASSGAAGMNTVRSGGFGSSSGNGTDARSGTAGKKPPASTVVPTTGSSGTGTPQPGRAGTARTAQSGSVSVKSVSSATEKSGISRSGGRPEAAPAGTAASTPARSTRYPVSNKQRRNSRRTAESGKDSTSGGVTRQSFTGTPTAQSGRAQQSETRSTRREQVRSERTEHTTVRSDTHSGTAGTTARDNARQQGQTPQSSGSVLLKAGLSPPKRQGSGTAQQETRRTSVQNQPPVNGTVRPGTAGTAPERSRAAQERRTAREKTGRAQTEPEGSGTIPGKRTGSGLIPPAKQSTAGQKGPDRSGHGGGGGHGG